jgi:hypothetical protein
MAAAQKALTLEMELPNQGYANDALRVEPHE